MNRADACCKTTEKTDTPTRTEEEGKYYFTGWTPEVTRATENTEYTAQFERGIPLTITAASDSMPLNNGVHLKNSEYTLLGDLQDGHRVESVDVSGEQKYPGSSDNIPSGAKIVDAEGNDVTYQYDISYVNGTLTVTWPEGIIRKGLTAFHGNLATYQITVRAKGIEPLPVLTGGFPPIPRQTP